MQQLYDRQIHNPFEYIVRLALPALCGASDNRAPELPPIAASLAAPEGNKVHFHAYAPGVQIYNRYALGGGPNPVCRFYRLKH